MAIRTRLKRSIFGLCVAAIPIAAWPAAAPAPVRAPAVQKVLDCRAETDDARRLACFDKAVAAMSEAEGSGDLVTIDREQRRAVRRQVFGLMVPSLAVFDRGEKAEEVDKLSVTLATVSKSADGKWILKLQDGAVWRQIDNEELFVPPRAGGKAVIRRGVMGSYLMNIEGQGSFHVHRDN